VNSSLSTSWLTENTLNYTKTLAEKHSINAVAGYTYQAFRFEGATANAANFNSDFASFNNLAAGATLQSPSSSVSESALISYLARVNYGFDNRYLVTLTARRDGSSRFGPSNKFGFFPSGAIAWKASNEKFFANQKTFSDVKFRASYGLTGNQEIGDYQFLSSLRVGSYVFGGTAGSVSVGSVPSGVSNLDLRWEKNAQFDVGVDFGILKNRISVTIDYYNKKTSDLLFLVNIPSSTGYFNSLKNVGSVENKGWEFDVNTVNVNNKNFRWNTNVNFSINKNSVLELDGRPEFTAGLGSGDLQISNPILLKVGEPLGNFYGRIMEGIFQNQGEIDKSAQKTAKPGDIKYSDIDGNGIINDNDRAIIGNAYPKYFGGLDNTISFRNFDLNIFWQGSFGNKILNLSRFELYGLNGQNAAKEIVDRWTPTNPSNTIPRANSAGGQKILSTFQIEDGSYLRLKNLSLGYNLPQTVLRSIALKSAKIYVSAQNLATITKYKGYDPEVSRHGNNSISQGMDLGAYPTAKTILVGAVIKF
jgi:TonB-linked SusC/RagA family outer membrane protein